jgi:hypothetical protein
MAPGGICGGGETRRLSTRIHRRLARIAPPAEHQLP